LAASASFQSSLPSNQQEFPIMTVNKVNGGLSMNKRNLFTEQLTNRAVQRGKTTFAV
jgi:hypothetical protein